VKSKNTRHHSPNERTTPAGNGNTKWVQAPAPIDYSEVAKGFGVYCAVQNELQICKGSEVFRFTFGEHEIRLAAPGLPEAVFLISPDATVDELRRGIAKLSDSW